MRCIFCKKDSTSSKSKEHIVPEALGNKDHVLEPGVVCDSCNNYFAVKIEKPILEYKLMTQMRFSAGIESKKGRIPPGLGWSGGSIVDVETSKEGISLIFHNASTINKIKEGRVNSLLIPAGTSLPIRDRLFSRLLGKMAIEFLTLKIFGVGGWNEEIVDKTELDHLRNFVRFDQGIRDHWLYNVREIHRPGQLFFNPKYSSEPYEVLHEMEILMTKENEIYFVLGLMGVECTINLGGPILDGYHAFLKGRDGVSVLDSRDERVKVER